MTVDKNLELKNLSHLLLTIHKSLLSFQLKNYQSTVSQKLSPYEALRLASEHPDFQWLRAISGLIAQMDEALYGRKKKEGASADILDQSLLSARAMFIDSGMHLEFKTSLEAVLDRSPDIFLEVAALKRFLERFSQ